MTYELLAFLLFAVLLIGVLIADNRESLAIRQDDDE